MSNYNDKVPFKVKKIELYAFEDGSWVYCSLNRTELNKHLAQFIESFGRYDKPAFKDYMMKKGVFIRFIKPLK